MISLLLPSRARPHKSFETYKNWRSKAVGLRDIEVILSMDNDDNTREEYLKLYWNSPVKLTSDWNRSAVDAINNAAKIATGNIFIVVSDDTDCPEFWDEKIYLATQGRQDWILKTQDGIQPWILTQPILDRAYYNRFGYIYYPEYQHLFCDTELSCVADITGRKIKSNLLFPHKHYSVTKEQPDAINKKADATWAQGEKLFLERYKRNFDLPKGGKIEGQGMIDWLIRKGQTV